MRLDRSATAAGGANELRRVSNQTARRLVIAGDGGKTLELAPFEHQVLAQSQLAPFDLDRWPQYVEVEEIPSRAFTGLLVAFGIGIWFALVYAVVGVFLAGEGYWLRGAALLAGALTLGLLFDVVRDARRRGLLDWGAQLLVLALLLGMGVGIPGALVYFLGDVDDLVREISNAARGEDVDTQVFAVAERALQLVFLATLTLLPALLFFLFDRQHLGTLRDDFIRHIIRFDPEVKTKRDVVAKYGARMSEAYGSDENSSRFVPATRSPLLLATLVIALGWTLTLLNADVGRGAGSPDGLVALFDPERSAITFGFLGAYFYALGSIFRGYIRKDLLPKAYTHITVRILLTIILAWVLDLVAQGTDAALALAFVAGILPETGIRVVEDYLRGVLRRRGDLRTLTDRHPLTNLDEIDIYDRGRLLDEGVNNVEALAHHDVIDLMLQTRIPVPRLVDWLDQAILYLHVGGYGSDKDDVRRQSLDALGMYGIRTATDLQRACEQARDREAKDCGPDDVEALLPSPAGADGAPPRIRVILDVIGDEEWMHNLRLWRGLDPSDDGALLLDAPRPDLDSNEGPTPAL